MSWVKGLIAEALEEIVREEASRIVARVTGPTHQALDVVAKKGLRRVTTVLHAGVERAAKEAASRVAAEIAWRVTGRRPAPRR